MNGEQALQKQRTLVIVMGLYLFLFGTLCKYIYNML